MVLKNVSMEIHKQKTVAVVGESGSGKSTLARAITGLLPPLEGTVTYHGEVWPNALKQRNKDQLRRLQMIYQLPDTALNPRQRIRDILGRPVEFYVGKKGKEKTQRVRSTATRANSRADRSSASALPAPWRRSRSLSSATSRPRHWTSWSPRKS
jgi:ABC-type glutathione transport system ATPase component